jgi:mRNA interferase RelE/StbE
MPTYQIKVHKQVQKFLLSLNPELRTRFRNKIENLRLDPYRHPKLDIKPMQGIGESVFRLRVGQYRLIYRVHEQELLIYLMTAGTRGDVYK